MNNFKEMPITDGRFKGKTAIFETSGINTTVLCTKCDWRSWQTFFIKDFTDKDIGRKCPRCDSKLQLLQENEI